MPGVRRALAAEVPKGRFVAGWEDPPTLGHGNPPPQPLPASLCPHPPSWSQGPMLLPGGGLPLLVGLLWLPAGCGEPWDLQGQAALSAGSGVLIGVRRMAAVGRAGGCLCRSGERISPPPTRSQHLPGHPPPTGVPLPPPHPLLHSKGPAWVQRPALLVDAPADSAGRAAQGSTGHGGKRAWRPLTCFAPPPHRSRLRLCGHPSRGVRRTVAAIEPPPPLPSISGPGTPPLCGRSSGPGAAPVGPQPGAPRLVRVVLA